MQLAGQLQLQSSFVGKILEAQLAEHHEPLDGYPESDDAHQHQQADYPVIDRVFKPFHSNHPYSTAR